LRCCGAPAWTAARTHIRTSSPPAGSMLLKPEVMLFDEPTGTLEPEEAAEVLDFIKNPAFDGTTMVIATHEADFAKQTADRVLFMDNGLFAERNTPKEFFSRPENRRTTEFLNKIL
jgi:ABC-type polar amino acid transport system ATPase subunit